MTSDCPTKTLLGADSGASPLQREPAIRKRSGRMLKQQDRKNILAVGAHPDDVEIMCGGTLFLLKDLGYKLHVATMTLGDCGSMEHPAEETRRIRQLETGAACALLNSSYHCLGFSDLSIFNDDSSNRRTTALLREVDPFVVFTHPPRDYMSDHEVTSLLVRNACFNASIPNYSTLSQAEPSSAIPHLIYTHPLEGVDIFGRKVKAQFYVDTSSSFDRKLEMLACHQSQREWLRTHHGIDEYLESVKRWSVETGRLASTVSGRIVTHAEAFMQHLGHSYPRENILKEMLGGKVIADRDY